MQILRGILLTVGTAIVFLAACATEWEPLPILLMGGTGLALCGIAGGIKKAAGRAGTRRGGRKKKDHLHYGTKKENCQVDIDEFVSLPDAPQEPTPCPVCGSVDCTDEICPWCKSILYHD